ncbi:Na+/H+ antiporter NhaC [Halocola ammonii]
MEDKPKVSGGVHLLLALLPIALLTAMLAYNVVFYGEDSSYGPNQIALLLAGLAGGIIGLRLGYNWKAIYDGIVDSITSAMGAIIILLLIGALAGTWLISGIIPAMVFYGLKILTPAIFLFAACIVSALVSVATGSSWSTIATVGLALLGIGTALDIYEGWIAGAIISGAYFGDKMSPLSDTTNLAPAVAGTDLFTHIRYMVWTTGPSIAIALIVFLIVGLNLDSKAQDGQVEVLMAAIEGKFTINLWLFLVPAIVIVMIIKKVPAIPALFAGVLLGAICAFIFQPDIIREVAGIDGSYFESAYVATINSMAMETNIPTENENVNDLLSAGGMMGMMNTIWLIICALTFGGVMQAAGLLRRITKAILALVNSTGSLIGSTAFTCVFFNVTASDQYLAIVVPGKMFAEAYRERGLAPENLSRTLEDSGTVTSVIIPWNTCGVAQAGVLGVATLVYAPYCIFNIASPVITVLYGIFDYKIKRLVPGYNKAEKASA